MDTIPSERPTHMARELSYKVNSCYIKKQVLGYHDLRSSMYNRVFGTPEVILQLSTRC